MSIILDFLPNHENIKIYQDDKMFRINTDTMALGEFLKVHKDDTVLDIGTNTGALLLYANMFNPKNLIGIDINSKALELAKKNMELNNITNYELIEADITKYKGKEVDVIICNPPYFKDNTDKSINEFKALAKHEGELNLENLMASIRRNLKNYGTLYFLFLSSRLEEVVLECKKNHLAIKDVKFVHDENKDGSNVFMIRAVKGLKSGCVVHKPLIISRKN